MLTEIQKKEIIALKREKPSLSNPDIAVMYGVSKSTINTVLKAADMGKGSVWWEKSGKACMKKSRPHEVIHGHEPKGKSEYVTCLDCGRKFLSPDKRLIRICYRCKLKEGPYIAEHRVCP